MKIISNLKNKLPWNYSQRLGYSKYLYFCLITPYIVFALACLISPSLRDRIEIIGIQKTISIIVSYSPIVGLVAVIVSCFAKIIGKLTTHSKKHQVKIVNKSTKHENMVIAAAISLIAVTLVFIYLVTAVISTLDVYLLVKIVFMLLPVAVLIYLAIYYSIITINK